MALEILSKGRPFRVHCSGQRKKKREKSFFKYLRHEGLWAFKPLHLKDIPENNLKTCLVYTYGMGGREALSPLDWIGDHPLSLRPENYLKTRLVYM